MAANETVPSETTSQISSTDLTAAPASTGISAPSAPTSDTFYPPQGPDQVGTRPGAVEKMEQQPTR